MRQLGLSYTVAGQVAEVHTSLAAVDPWLWLRERVKLVEFIWVELMRTRLIWIELTQIRLVWAELVRIKFMRTELV